MGTDVVDRKPPAIDEELIARARTGDVDGVRALVDRGADVEARDEHGWTPLCWAAGAGHETVVRLLLERGADPFGTGKDRRTPYHIALAASRAGVARVLADAEAVRGDPAAARSSRQAERRPYCRAYHLRELRRFQGWPEGGGEPGGGAREPLSDDAVVFVHRDFSVTRTMRPSGEVMFDGTSPAWRRFCVEELAFHPPSDFDWLPAREA